MSNAPNPTKDPLDRIKALTANARNTWFALLAALVFVGVTLMGVEHIDFYGVGRATELPLINVDVPTWLFFYAAPILTAAVYGYFHLYLIRLWDALGQAPAEIDGEPLGDKIVPWLVSDAALYLRSKLRDEDPACTRPRSMEASAALLNVLLAWVFGLVILYFIWRQSLPARDFWMTALAALSLIAAATAGYASARVMWLRMRYVGDDRAARVLSELPLVTALCILGPALLIFSHSRTTEPSDWVRKLAALEMPAEELVDKPDGWLPHQIARDEFLATWCGRNTPTCKSVEPDTELPRAFLDEWRTRRSLAISDLAKPHWQGPDRSKPSFRNANLIGAFLSGANLLKVQMDRADLIEAQLEATNLNGASLYRTDFTKAHLQGAFLVEAQMERADLTEAHLQGADFSDANMRRAFLTGAQMRGAILSWAKMQDTELWGAQMQGVFLYRTQLQGAQLGWAHLEGAHLKWAQLQRADLSYSYLAGTDAAINLIEFADFSAATNEGGALRFADLRTVVFDRETDFRNAFLDGSVALPDGFAEQMATEGQRPCQWSELNLSDNEFFGRWRGWIEAEPDYNDWELVAPAEFRDIPAIPPETGCEWKTERIPGANVREEAIERPKQR